MQHPNTSVSGKYLLPLTSYEESRIITTGSHKASQSTFTSYNELRTYRIVRKISDMKYLDFIKQEMAVIMDRDPAIKSKMEVFLYPSFWALLKYRKAHKLYEKGHFYRARRLSQKTARKTGIEIHPGATIGEGLFIDHGHGVVIGETAIIGDNVTLYQGVTLGGTGKEQGKRHPIDWILLSESRGPEVAHLLNSLSTGSYCMTTMHLDDVRDMPDRMYNMLGSSNINERFINSIYKYIDLVVLIECDKYEKRCIKQVGFLSRENGHNMCSVIYEDGAFTDEKIPAVIMDKFLKKGIKNIYEKAD